MSYLGNLQISSSFQGLLNLEDSSSGITNNQQLLNDGLGNSMNVEISNETFTDSNHINKKYYSSLTTGQCSPVPLPAGVANTQNRLWFAGFYDSGLYSYSAVSFNLYEATTTSDTLDFAFYTSRMTQYGMYPDILQFSGSITDLTTLGEKKIIFPSDISFSGNPGFNYFSYIYNNSNSTPTAKFFSFYNTTLIIPTLSLGFVESQNAIGSICSSGLIGGAFFGLTGSTNYPNSYTPNDIYNSMNKTTTFARTPGFYFHISN